MYNFTGRRQK